MVLEAENPEKGGCFERCLYLHPKFRALSSGSGAGRQKNVFVSTPYRLRDEATAGGTGCMVGRSGFLPVRAIDLFKAER
jgi:hypothetical protein